MEKAVTEKAFIIGIDQSTQGTKALLFDREGRLLLRTDAPHRQLVNEKGWVSHDPEEIYQNTVKTVTRLVEQSGIGRNQVAAIGISNQRETSLIWDRISGKLLADAVVWQCARGAEICRQVEEAGLAGMIRERTGLTLSPYFPASKFAWLLQNADGAMELARRHQLCLGTIDTWLVYRLTGGRAYKTDYSNASRTQLYDIFRLKWDQEICQAFGVDAGDLPEVCDSDSFFGETDLEGFFEELVPIRGVLGDSHGALFGQGCLRSGMVKATYGTGSSVMMNIGPKAGGVDRDAAFTQPPCREKVGVRTPCRDDAAIGPSCRGDAAVQTPCQGKAASQSPGSGVVTSLAWGLNGKVDYVLEGNINYTGAVISWLKDDLELIRSPQETEELCRRAKECEDLYFIPAFTGLGAPYWDSDARGALLGVTRACGRAEFVRACVDCIAYQIADVVEAMEQSSGIRPGELRVDGGPTGNGYLMEMQSGILNTKILVPSSQELSGMGAAYAAGMAAGLYDERIFDRMERKVFVPQMEETFRRRRLEGWKRAVRAVLTEGRQS